MELLQTNIAKNQKKEIIFILWLAHISSYKGRFYADIYSIRTCSEHSDFILCIIFG